MLFGDLILISLAAIAMIPIGVIAVETLIALIPRRRDDSPRPQDRPKCAILIPAHNEEAGIAQTIALLRKEMCDGDRLVVIADNCADHTAEVACREGAEALVRDDPEKRGKGYALAFGLNHLATEPPDIVVLVDADTRIVPESLNILVSAAVVRQAPVQGVFTDAPKLSGPREQWSAFALTFKNFVRPLGLHRLGFPCLLTGSGMAFPWAVIRKVELGTGNIVEDMQLGIDLAVAGYPPRFCPDARFESDDAPSISATVIRRTRWEHGHVFTSLTQVPRLIIAGLVQLRPQLIVLALELCVPPLSLLFMMQALLLGICLANWHFFDGSGVPALIVTIGLGAGAMTIMTAWFMYGRRLISLKILCLLPVYILWKVPIYLKLVVAPQKKWVRTERKTAG